MISGELTRSPGFDEEPSRVSNEGSLFFDLLMKRRQPASAGIYGETRHRV
jgi:hypothetical protein